MPVKHVAIYIPSLRGGGAERVMVTLANGFAARGHRVDLVLVKTEGPYLKEVADNVRIIDLNKRRALDSLTPLARYIRRNRPDAMLSALTHANVIAILARKFARVKMRLVVSERSSLTRGSGARAMRLWHLLMRVFYPSADAVVAVSRGMTSQLVEGLGLAAERVTAIPNPVDIATIQHLAKERPQHPWLASGQPPIILAVGRLTLAKDYPILLEAFARLRGAGREARLVILGEGELRPALERRIAELGLSDSVALLGFQPNPFGWMAACRVYVLSSRFEGFPNSLVQAMACGARVVSTDCPTGPSEILEHGKWGRLVPPRDVDALAEALVAALANTTWPDATKRLSAYDVDIVVADYLRILDDEVEDSNQPKFAF
ncbi:glycosyltransferase [Brevundimonas vesicularis]|uniref:glycosyltransferase n=1 Tax=Brevundimonas vesicularis TaxID=41276 RepID=UPI00384F9CB8